MQAGHDNKAFEKREDVHAAPVEDMSLTCAGQRAAHYQYANKAAKLIQPPPDAAAHHLGAGNAGTAVESGSVDISRPSGDDGPDLYLFKGPRREDSPGEVAGGRDGVETITISSRIWKLCRGNKSGRNRGSSRLTHHLLGNRVSECESQTFGLGSVSAPR
ncbi:unnamed protein product [Pleuronectes platessa]|uniref:Uncharacterized protein n=1 Tax=Pleuronectes platessa TaxID=8262 RepID=A0A9N7VE36_PLEPL|nr:unnamed protein product [Pleuronectes platessa]